ncbi:MAG: guanylate kinase [Betaproteobacteria bacterium]|nr:guanylate kinase [Betaproteobacteria bacterium]
MMSTLFIVCAPSGAGKTSLVNALLARDPAIELSVSYTTREPRPGETDGRQYHFVTRAKFQEMLEQGAFLESAQVHGNYYGTSQAWISDRMKKGADLLLEIDWQGAAQVRTLFPQCVSVFIVPPSAAALRERLTNRGQDSAAVIERRLAAARDEISRVSEFDYVIINQRFEDAVEDLHSIVRAQRLRAARQLAMHSALINAMK